MTSPAAPEKIVDWRMWLLGALFSVCLALIGVVYTALDHRVELIASQQNDARERMAALEATQQAMQRQLDSDIKDLRETSKLISAKLDRLIEERHK